MEKNISTEVSEVVADRAVNRVVQQQQRFVNRAPTSPSESGRSVSRSGSNERLSSGHNFVLGQIVKCKSSAESAVYTGVVMSVQPLTVKVDGFETGRWRLVRPKELLEVVLPEITSVYERPDARRPEIKKINAGMRVRILEFVGDFAQIIDPVEGWIRMKQPGKSTTPAVNANPVQMPPTQPVVCQPMVPAPVLPSVQFLVAQDMSAKDLAMACQKSGCLPKKVSMKMIDGRRVGVVGFENLSSAELVMNRGITHRGYSVQRRWAKEYLNFRSAEKAI